MLFRSMVFGKNNSKGIRLNGLTPEIISMDDTKAKEQVLLHDAALSDPTMAFILSQMNYPNYPVPMGILRSVEKPCYGDYLKEQEPKVKAEDGTFDLQELLNSGETWCVE